MGGRGGLRATRLEHSRTQRAAGAVRTGCAWLWAMEGALDTERLRLYPLTEADLDDLVDLDADPEVRRII